LKDEEKPATVAAGSIFAAGVATERFARRCTAIASGDTGGLAATTACAKAVEGTRLLIIIVALAMMNSFVEVKMRDRRAVTFRFPPRGEDLRNAGTIVELL
jgi:hypothetical protein